MYAAELYWQAKVPDGLISPGEVHVWRSLLNEPGSQIEKMSEILSIDELDRAGKFHFEKDRRRYIMARGTLRTILSRYLDKSPREINFYYTSFGKPFIAYNAAINFNLSHSNEMVLYAVTLNRNIGVDVEHIKNSIDAMEIARRFFSPRELAELEGIHEKERAEVFFSFWVRKESLIKSLGKGVSIPMEQIDVSFIDGRGLTSIPVPAEICTDSNWYIQDLYAGEGYMAAIALEGCDCKISCRHYSP